MNKHGEFPLMLLFFIIVAVILVAGLFLSMGTSVIKIFTDVAIPELESIGSVGGSNISQYSAYVTTPIDIFVNSLSWMGGVVYLIAFIGLFGIALGFRVTMNKWLIGLFVLFAVLIIFMSIFISNIYESLYQDGTEFGENIRDQTLLSFLILQSPLILTIVIFVSGIVMFTGVGREAEI